MPGKRKVIAICGSTRSKSTNLNLIHAIEALWSKELEITIYNSLSELPQFNPDLDNELLPPLVSSFREKLRKAEGILICTPEYAMGVPGALKNAIDWTVSSCEFSQKPVALITASTSGLKAHASLLDTLHVIEAQVGEAHMVISFAKTKVNERYEITNEDTQQGIEQVIVAFIAAIEQTRE